MENKNKVIIAGVLLMALAIGLMVSKGQSSDQTAQDKTNIELSDKTEEHQAFAVPSNHPAHNRQKEASKKLIQSKIAKFQRRARSNQTTLMPTTAHEFHNPNGQSLAGAEKVKAVATKAKKKEHITEVEKKKAAELAKSQAFMEKECGDIKSNEEKAECHQAVAFYLNQQKKKAALEKAKKAKKDKQKEEAVANNSDNPVKSEDLNEDIDDSNENTQDPNPSVVTNTANNITTETPTPTPTGETAEDNKPKTLAQWRDFMVVTDEEGGSLFAKAPVLLAATKKTGKDSLALNDFYVLIREYYLQSGNAELEFLGMQTLNGVQSLLSFRNAVAFFGQENIASTGEQLAEIDAIIRNTYQQDSQLGNLNIFLNTFALPAVIAEEGDETTTPWNKKDPLFLTIQYIRGYSEAKLASISNLNTETDNTNVLKLINPITSIQSDLRALIEDTETVEVVRTDAAGALGSVSLLLEKLITLKPVETTTPETQTPTTLTGFAPR